MSTQTGQGRNYDAKENPPAYTVYGITEFSAGNLDFEPLVTGYENFQEMFCEDVFLTQSRLGTNDRVPASNLAPYYDESMPTINASNFSSQVVDPVLLHTTSSSMTVEMAAEPSVTSTTTLPSQMPAKSAGAFACDNCGKIYARRRDLKIHLQFNNKDVYDILGSELEGADGSVEIRKVRKACGELLLQCDTASKFFCGLLLRLSQLFLGTALSNKRVRPRFAISLLWALQSPDADTKWQSVLGRISRSGTNDRWNKAALILELRAVTKGLEAKRDRCGEDLLHLLDFATRESERAIHVAM